MKKTVKNARKTAAKKSSVKTKAAKKAAPAPKNATRKKVKAKVVAPKKAAGKTIAKPRVKKATAKKTIKTTPAKKVVAKKVAAEKVLVKKVALRKVAAKKPPAVKKSVVTKKPTVAAPPKPTYPALIQTIINQLDDSKAEAIVTINLEHKSTMADWMIVASGRSDRHVNAIANQTVEQLHKQGLKNIRVEGMPQCDWVLVDSGDVIIHVFRPEVRSFYNLEKLWSGERP